MKSVLRDMVKVPSVMQFIANTIPPNAALTPKKMSKFFHRPKPKEIPTIRYATVNMKRSDANPHQKSDRIEKPAPSDAAIISFHLQITVPDIFAVAYKIR